METSIGAFFGRYESLFNKALNGDADMAEVASLYAPELVAALPAGIGTAKNDVQLRQVMARGYARQREIGTKDMRIRGIRLSPIDDRHCVAHVAWTATYARRNGPDTAIDFDVHYFLRDPGGEPKVFGWVSGDEEALLRQHGII
jgi:hypothetical protein